MKNILFSIIAILLGLNCYSQKPVPQKNIANDYYLNYWMHNVDSFYYSLNNERLPQSMPASIPQYSEQEYVAFIDKLNSDVPMRFYPRVSEILSLYIEKTNSSSKALAYSIFLGEQFAKSLKKHGLPNALKHLPFALTAMNNMAQGETGASGLWQLNYSTARREGLDIDSYVDERKNIEKATEAACVELSRLYELYQNWELALGAYACGPSNINKTIRRLNNERDYYMLYPKFWKRYSSCFNCRNNYG